MSINKYMKLKAKLNLEEGKWVSPTALLKWWELEFYVITALSGQENIHDCISLLALFSIL